MENNNNSPQVTASEVKDWEDKFKANVSAQVQFTPATNSANGQSLSLYNGASGVEALWSGTIILGADNYINWSFSIQNEPFIEAKMNLNENNFTIVQNLYNFYNSWKEEWSKQLSLPNANMDDTQNMASGGPSAPAPEQPTPQAGPVPTPPIQENRRTKLAIIEDHKERMQKLSGLR